MANITEAEIRKIVESIIKGTSVASNHLKYSSTEYDGRKLIGIYADMNDAIDAAERGYKAVRAMTVEQREKTKYFGCAFGMECLQSYRYIGTVILV